MRHRPAGFTRPRLWSSAASRRCASAPGRCGGTILPRPRRPRRAVSDREGEPSGVARIAGPGETFAEACICGLGSYFVTAEALARATVVAIEREPLRALLEQRSDLVLAVLGEMSLRLRGLVRQITDLKMKTTAQRLAAHLVRLTEAESGSTEIRLPYGKKLLASQLGMQPETLSRAFLKLQSLGVRCVVAENRLRIRDMAVLREFSQDVEENA